MTEEGPKDRDYRATIREAVLQEETFLRLTVSDRAKGEGVAWTRIVLRPVLAKGQRQVQFAYFDGKRTTTKNFAGVELGEKLDELLVMPFGQFLVQSTSGDLQVRVTGKGRVRVRREAPSRPERQPELSHNRAKAYPIPADAPDAFLQAIGIMDRNGRVRPPMQGKFRQIAEFLKLIEQVVRPEAFDRSPIEVLDCGCGSAYLTFAAFHFLNHIRGVPARAVGIDSNPETIARCLRLRDTLRWDGLEFCVSRIADFEAASPPAAVLSLHACDTATDEAIARAVLWKSRVVLAAPCCQHELHAQLRAPLFRPVLRHGILKQRTADILTDAFRALALRIVGYRTDVVEFISPEHTSKNLMIRAVNALPPGDPASVREYRDLKAFWEVEPCIEALLGEEFTRFLR